MLTIFNKNKANIVAQPAEIAKSFFQRLIGLMFRSKMDKGEALIFYQAPSIHTFFMKFPIDIVFLDKNKKVIRICPALKPWRIVFCPKAYITIELAPQRAREVNLEPGDVLDVA